jgi:polyhydroxybutyrate depolymerase
MRNQTWHKPYRPGPGRAAPALCLLSSLVLCAAGCGDAGKLEPAPAAPSAAVATRALRGPDPIASRPYKSLVPSHYDATTPTPLVILLHGFGASGALQEDYFHLSALAESRTFLYAYPDGLQDPLGLRYWNAMEWCCDFFKSGVDDVGYIRAVIADMSKKYNVDKQRIFIIGHSNGGFMAHRMACELADTVAGIVSLAGAQWTDPTRCLPSQPVAIAQIHGNLDAVISYNGSANYPSAHQTVDIWANRNRCTGALTYGGDNLDLDALLPGAETRVERYTGCPAEGPVELWTIQGGSHIPTLSKYFTGAVYDFLMAHPKA